MSRRIYALLLLTALVLPLLAACGESNTGTQGTGGGQPTAATGGAAQPTTAGGAAQPTAAAEPTTAGGAAQPTAAGGGSQGANGQGTAGGNGDITQIQVEDGATLRVATWGDPSEQEVNQQAFERFKELFPNVEITYEPRPTEFQTSMKADVAGGTEPDVFYLDTSLMNAFAPNSLLLELDSHMQQAGISADDYLGDLAQLYQHDGKTYGLPKDFGALALFVRNDFAQEAGVDPASITTWQAWQDAAQKLTKGEGNDKIFGQCSSFDPQRVGALWVQRGTQVVENNQPAFNTEQGQKAVSFWYDMQKNGYAALPSDVGADWCGQALGEGKVAMALEGGWMLPFLAKDYSDVEYTALPIPTSEGGEQGSLVFTNAWAASARTKYPNAAAALVLYLTSAHNQKPIMETGFAMPTVQGLLEDPYFEQNPNAKVLVEAGDYGTLADLYFTREHKDDVIKELNEALEAIWLGQSDVPSALSQAEQDVQQLVGQ